VVQELQKQLGLAQWEESEVTTAHRDVQVGDGAEEKQSKLSSDGYPTQGQHITSDFVGTMEKLLLERKVFAIFLRRAEKRENDTATTRYRNHRQKVNKKTNGNTRHQQATLQAEVSTTPTLTSTIGIENNGRRNNNGNTDDYCDYEAEYYLWGRLHDVSPEGWRNRGLLSSVPYQRRGRCSVGALQVRSGASWTDTMEAR